MMQESRNKAGGGHKGREGRGGRANRVGRGDEDTLATKEIGTVYNAFHHATLQDVHLQSGQEEHKWCW